MHLLFRHSFIFAALLCFTLECHAGLVEIIAKAKRSDVAVGTYSAVENPRFGFRGTAFVVGEGNLLVAMAVALPGQLGSDAGERPGYRITGVEVSRNTEA